MDIYDSLKKDHERQRTLAEILSKTEGASDGRQDLWPKFMAEIEAHAAAEEQVFYAELMAEPSATDQTRHSVAEHQQASKLVKEINDMDMSSSAWLPKFKELAHSIVHHVDEEEADVFPIAKNHISPSRAEALGKKFDDRKAAELTAFDATS